MQVSGWYTINMDKIYYEDIEKFEKDLEDMLWDDPETALAMGLGHSKIHMRGKETAKDMITRILDEGVKGSGSFLGSEEEAKENIQQSAIYNAKNIVKWAVADRGMFKSENEYQYLAFSVNMGNQVTGTGLRIDEKTGNIVEMESHGTRIVLKRDRGCVFGFHLRTAYADHRIAKPTGRVYSRSDIINGGLYDFPDRLSFASYANQNDNVLTYYGKDRNHEPYIKVVHKNSKCVAFIKETSTRYYDESNTERRKINRDELLNIAPDMLDSVEEIENLARRDINIKTDTQTEKERMRQEVYAMMNFSDTKKPAPAQRPLTQKSTAHSRGIYPANRSASLCMH
ncbi:MAG: hypothetical protein J5966_05765 [Lachnospiraceae bacterium]|nr:hypothetical protein [Lachnospiraceae bacterium]